MNIANKVKRFFFRKLISTLDEHQLKWILNHNYPEWEKELVKQELSKRCNKYDNER
ncbi:hypothetical protein QY95_01946 [Bacillus thermotolerans]|uniref:Uncharacterized protein n=1 Tax=Bacillus thermotolerans TaxID=1221996 RepID=A0A0F5I342_BACTR|nr:hypothetical protein QY95_01946 [Bacillus thermotolerans]